MTPVNDLRSLITFLEAENWLKRITDPVDTVFELAAIAKKMEEGPALLFENVKGYDIPVVLGTDNRRDHIAKALGTDDFGLIHRYLEALSNPLPPVKVDDGPVKEVKLLDDINITKTLPVITHYERDGGPYITSGLLIAEDPENDIRNVSYHRLQITGPDEIRLLIQPRHLWELLERAEKKNKPLPVAVAIGTDTAIRLAAATWGSTVPSGLDELAIAGRLRQQAVEIVRCETIDVYVPAQAEIILEGEILPNKRATEGPFAEFTGNYGDAWENPILKIKAITHRRRPIYQALLTFTPEHHLLLGIPYEPALYKTVKAYVPGTKAICVTPGGCGKFHAVVCIEKHHEGDGKDAIIAGLYSIRDIKLITVVDDDVNPFNARDVEWAMATRFQADRDLVVIEGAKGNELDPSCPSLALTAKMGIDATKPLDRPERFERIKIPGFEEM